MKNSKFVFSLLALLSFVRVFPVFPQSQLLDAHLTGTLTDPSGASVAGARITAQPEGDAAANFMTTDSAADGSYSLALPPGRYIIHFFRDPFAPRELTWDLAPG